MDWIGLDCALIFIHFDTPSAITAQLLKGRDSNVYTN